MTLSPSINHSNPQTSLNHRLLTSISSSCNPTTIHSDGVDSFIPLPNSAQESSVLKRLREISNSKSKSNNSNKALSGSDSISSNHSISNSTTSNSISSSTSNSDSDQQESNLSWSNSTLVWSRNGQLIRTFTFQEQVTWARWSWFQDEAQHQQEPSRLGDETTSGGKGNDNSNGIAKGKGKEREKEIVERDGKEARDGMKDGINLNGNATHSDPSNKNQNNGSIGSSSKLDTVPPFTPAQSQMQPSSHQSSSSTNHLNPFSRSNASSSSNSLVLKLVIFLKTTLILYDPKRSDMNSIDLPFPIEQGGKMILKSPSGIGILLVREEERDDRKWIEIKENQIKERKKRQRKDSREPSSPDGKFRDLSLDSEMIDRFDQQLNRDLVSDEEGSGNEDEEEEMLLQRPSSLAFYLRKPLDEFNGLFSYRNITFSRAEIFNSLSIQTHQESIPSRQPRILLHEELSPFTEVDDKLIQVRNLNESSHLPHKTPQLLITANHRLKKIRIWNYCDSNGRIENFGSLKKEGQQDEIMLEVERQEGFKTKTDRATNLFSDDEISSQTQTQPIEGSSSQQEHDSQQPSSLPANFETDPNTFSTPSNQKGNLGRGRPPPRKSARLDKGRRSSGVGSSSLIGGSGPNTSINLGGRDANGRSRRLSSRISSTSGNPNNHRNVSSTHHQLASTSNFENDFNLLSDGNGVSQGLVEGGVSRPDEFAVQQLAEDLIRHRSSCQSQSQAGGGVLGDNDHIMARNPSTNSASGGAGVTNRNRRTSQSHPNQVVRPSNRARLSRASIVPSNPNTSSVNMARSVSQSQATPGPSNVGVGVGGRPRLSHASSYRSESGIGGNDLEIRDREFKRGGVSMTALGSNGLPIPSIQNGKTIEVGSEFEKMIVEDERLELEEEEEREREELEHNLELQSFSQSFAAVSLLEEIDCEDLKDSECSSNVTAHFIEIPPPSSSNKESQEWPMIQIMIPCSKMILTRQIRSEEVKIEVPSAISGSEGQDSTNQKTEILTRYVLKTGPPSPSRASSRIEALTAITLDSTGSLSSASGISDLLVVKNDGTSVLGLGAIGGESSCEIQLDLLKMIRSQSDSTAHNEVIQSLEESRGSKFIVNFHNTKDNSNSKREVNLDLRPWCKKTQWVLQSFDLLLDTKTSRLVRKLWIQERFGEASSRDASDDDEEVREDWASLFKVLAGNPSKEKKSSEQNSWRSLLDSNSHENHFDDVFLPSLDSHSTSSSFKSQTKGSSSLAQQISTDTLKSILQVLHLLAQESRLNVLKRKSHLESFAQLIVRLSSILGAQALADYWIRLVPDAITSLGTVAALNEGTKDFNGFDVYDLLYSMFSKDFSSSSLQDLLPSMNSIHLADASLNLTIPRIKSLLYVFSKFSPSSDNLSIAQRVTEALVKTKIGSSEIELLPLAISIPIKEALRSCQLNPPNKWSVEAYRLADRPELARQLEVDEGIGLVPSRRIEPHLFKTLPRTVNLDPISAQLFAGDYRLREVTKMLQTNVPQPVYSSDRGDKTEQQIKDEITRLRVGTIERTKACTIGRGMFVLASGRFVPTEKWRCPNLCLETPVFPPNSFHSNSTISQEMSELEWPMFHNGVSTALEIAQGVESMDSNWIYSHSSPESSSKHAGFLFGLGLMGHLSVINKVHGFRYLRDRHNVTTVGTLLGVAAARVGTGEPGAQSIMAVQVAAFLPSRNVDLNMSTLTQAAALMSMGILFLGSSHRWTAENMLSQIGAKYIQTSEAQYINREAYSLSAAFALGLVMLGRGHRKPMTSIPDRKLVKGIVELMVGKAPSMFEDTETDPSSFEWSLNTSITGSCATISLGFIFIRSNRSDISDLIPLPQTMDALDEVRPDVLLVRVLAKGLIMWNSIEASEKWVESVLPDIISHVRVSDKKAAEAAQLASLNTRTAACFLIGLRYAGSGDQTVKSFLLDYFHRFDHEADIRTTSYFARVRQSALRTGSNLVALSLAMVMAGTGDVDLLRLFRKAHGKIEIGTYGTHAAIHMALGLLFLGGGRFTLGQSDAAIAMLVISFFPPFPNSPSDNRAHLQAYRHLWCLAVEPRLLVAEDIETKKVSYLPIKLVQRGDLPDSTIEKVLNAPALVPGFSDIVSLSTATERYWPSSLNVSTNSAHSRKLLVTRTMQVKRRTGYLSYADDPNGFRSIFNTSSNSSDWVAIGLASDPSVDSSFSDLRELVKTFTTAPQHRAFVDLICSAPSNHSTSSKVSSLKRFYTDALMECLTLDKPSMIGPYLSLYSLRTLGNRNKFSGLHLRDLEKVIEFYDLHSSKTLGISSDSNDPAHSVNHQRKPLVCRALLDHIRINTKKNSISDSLESNNSSRLLVDYPSYLINSTAFDNPEQKKIESRQLSFQLASNEIPDVETLSILKDLIVGTYSEIKDQVSKEEAALIMKSILRSLLVGEQDGVEGGEKKERKLGSTWLETEFFDEVLLKSWLESND